MNEWFDYLISLFYVCFMWCVISQYLNDFYNILFEMRTPVEEEETYQSTQYYTLYTTCYYQIDKQ